MGIEIRYVAPAAAGTRFTYSVQRRADGSFFDFERGIYRPLGDIAPRATAAAMAYRKWVATATFSHLVAGEEYIIRVRGRADAVVAVLPITAAAEGGQPMEPSYRAGKKFVDGKAIEAEARLTFYGNDGFTIHTATLWADGTSSCNCPRWTKKDGPVRRCPHSDRALTLIANVDETGERPEPPAPATQEATSPFRRRSRHVDT